MGDRLFGHYYALIRSKTDWPASMPESGLLFWRERILFGMLAAGISLGFAPFGFGIALLIREGMWGAIPPVALVFAWAATMLFIRGLSFEIRAWSILIFTYFAGLVILIALGPGQCGILYLFTSSIVAGVLLGKKGLVGATLLNLAGLAAVSRLLAAGGLGWKGIGG